MRLSMDGSFSVKTSLAETYAFLTDPERFAPLLPMFKSLESTDDDAFDLVMEVGVPQIRGRAEVHVVYIERKLDEYASLSSTVRHSLGVADASLQFSLESKGTGTQVTWTCDSTVRGTLASVASGILKPLARRNVSAMIASVQNELGAAEDEDGPKEAPVESGTKSKMSDRVSSWLSRHKKVTA
ncbi:CoxG family protein [Pusillimonas sp. NJUB218]|uniref:CoxG family protein n=1 Tax=Pusillimonas sp. NJUB218 TaxID=2023230 RepID=UPI000F4AFD77|nr:SRPBCC domain-containing protein [Pusillimonas sp. NJUB218]ROT43909.1 hypothetical protein CHR62_15130 [Pusillimonas sp. NJUB218]